MGTPVIQAIATTVNIQAMAMAVNTPAMDTLLIVRGITPVLDTAMVKLPMDLTLGTATTLEAMATMAMVTDTRKKSAAL